MNKFNIIFEFYIKKLIFNINSNYVNIAIEKLNILIFIINNIFINAKKNIKFNIKKIKKFLIMSLFIFTRVKRRKIISIFNIDRNIIKNKLIDSLLNNYVDNIINFLLFLFDNNNDVINFQN